MSRVIAIGDIHGCASAFERLLHEISPQKNDMVICLGDYVDRGLDSSRVIEICLDLVTRCRFVPLIGNHELMMFRGLRSKQDLDFWCQHGGLQTLQSYCGNPRNVPQHHVTFLSHCVRYFETDTHFFVHANYLADLPLSGQPDEVLFWQHIEHYFPPPHQNGKIAVVGHTPQVSGQIRNLGHVQILDTYCYGDQWLSAMDVQSGKIWQANNFGDFRMAELPPPEFHEEPSQEGS